MNKKVLLTIFIISSISIIGTYYLFFNSQYHFYDDIVLSNDNLYALTIDGNIDVLNIENGKNIKNDLFKDLNIKYITNDHLRNLIILDRSENIFRFDEELAKIGRCDTNVFEIVFTRKNETYLIAHKGISRINSDRLWFETNNRNHQLSFKSGFPKPSSVHVDKNDRIWITFNYGEWGGELYIFDTNTHSFLKEKIDGFDFAFYPLIDIMENENNVYIISTNYHMGNRSTIFKMNGLDPEIIISHEDSTPKYHYVDDVRFRGGCYIEDAEYNGYENSIYYYSWDGYFKGNLHNDLSKPENWELISKPKFRVKEIKFPIKLKHLERSSSKLIIVRENKFFHLKSDNLLHFYDGKELKILN